MRGCCAFWPVGDGSDESSNDDDSGGGSGVEMLFADDEPDAAAEDDALTLAPASPSAKQTTYPQSSPARSVASAKIIGRRVRGKTSMPAASTPGSAAKRSRPSPSPSAFSKRRAASTLGGWDSDNESKEEDEINSDACVDLEAPSNLDSSNKS